MKLCHKGVMSFGTKLTVSDRIKNVIGNFFKGSEKNEPTIYGDGKVEAELDYEFSLDITSEEAKCLFDEVRTNADKEIDLCKRIGNGLLSYMKDVRKFAEEEIPLWQDLEHQYKIKEILNSRERDNARYDDKK